MTIIELERKKWLEANGASPEMPRQVVDTGRVFEGALIRQEALRGVTLEDLTALTKKVEDSARRFNLQNWATIFLAAATLFFISL